MFKTIIATCLLTFSCSSGCLKKVDTPKRSLEQSNVLVTGYYNFRDEMEWPNQYGTLNLLTESQDVEMYAYIDNEYLRIFSLTLNYSIQNAPNYLMSLNAEYYDEDEGYNISGTWNLGSGTNGQYQYLSNYNDTAKNFILYVASQFYFTETSDNNFIGFFTHDNNEYMTSYEGYFHLGLNYVSSDYAVMGNFLIDNNIYVELFDESTDSLMYAKYYDFVNGERVLKDRFVFGENRAPKNRNIYMSINKLPIRDKSKFETFGTFQYINDTPNSTWYEMILSVMDAPIYYLKNLLGFELFGIELFVALGSLLTLVLVLVVVKKVI